LKKRKSSQEKHSCSTKIRNGKTFPRPNKYLKETELTGYTEEEEALVKLEKSTSVKNNNERVTSVDALQG